MLEIQNLSYRYRLGVNVLDGVSFSLSKGETLCLLGPNGTGKTTLLKCLLGFVRPKSGAILLDGINTSRISHKARAKLLAYVPQSTALAFPYEAREVVLMGRVAHLTPGTSHSAEDKQIAMDMLKTLGIEHLAARRFQELSGGERQMVIVARALAQRADYLVMDEPTANLDYSNQVKILKTIRALSEQGYGILMTSHCPDHAFLACGKAVLLRGGRVQSEGTPESTVTSQSLSELYQTSICVSQTVADGREVKVCVPVLD